MYRTLLPITLLLLSSCSLQPAAEASASQADALASDTSVTPSDALTADTLSDWQPYADGHALTSSQASDHTEADSLSDWRPFGDSLFIEGATVPADFVLLSDVCPDIMQEIRYYTTFNFVGRRIPGYTRPLAYLSRPAADSLRAVSQELKQRGYRLKVFDAYRPQQAVTYFIRWARDMEDQLMKPYFYPDCPKSELFRRGYLAHKSGHSRGSTVDVTLFDVTLQRDADMGSTYDLLGEASHYSYTTGLTSEQISNRRLLRDVMSRHGFRPIACEWWHFTLRNEPYPNTYFDFEIR